MNCPVRYLTEELIRRKSVTPQDAGCLDLIGDRLSKLGFNIERMDKQGVSNLWATYGTDGPMICFAGHTDVVPPGNLKHWSSYPFEPAETADGMLIGRGAADMKTSLAAMVVACESFLKDTPKPQCRLAFLLTSDEEGPATDGTAAVVDILKTRQKKSGIMEIDFCIVGEPSSKNQLGDVVRIGRRGSLNARIDIKGIQGHVAYPESIENPIHGASRLINTLNTVDWDVRQNEAFPATSFQVSKINAGAGANNIVPGTCNIDCNWRFSTSTSGNQIQSKVAEVLNQLGIKADIEWSLSGEPFLTRRGRLINAVTSVIHKHTGLSADLSTGGGTSDGRFIAQLGCEIIELGPVNRSIHKIDEEVRISEMPVLKDLYHDIIVALID